MDADIDSGEGTIEAVDEPAENDEFRLELLTLAEWALIAVIVSALSPSGANSSFRAFFRIW